MSQNICTHSFFLSLAILLAMMVVSGDAFTVSSTTRHVETRLNAWTMPINILNSSPALPLDVLSTSWYTEGSTSRKVVYNDQPIEYTLVSAGSDWPTMMDSESSPSNQQQQQRRVRLNPIRKAARWARARRSQQQLRR